MTVRVTAEVQNILTNLEAAQNATESLKGALDDYFHSNQDRDVAVLGREINAEIQQLFSPFFERAADHPDRMQEVTYTQIQQYKLMKYMDVAVSSAASYREDG